MIAPFLVATYVNGEHALPVLRPAASLSDAVALANDLAGLGLVRVFTIVADRIVPVASMRGRELAPVRGHECSLCGGVKREP